MGQPQKKLEIVPQPQTSGPRVAASRPLMPVFSVVLRKRRDESAPTLTVSVQARTMASARHLVRQEHPEAVVLSIARV